jgi:hypothetical protein
MGSPERSEEIARGRRQEVVPVDDRTLEERLEDRYGPRPTVVASCPICLRRSGEILPKVYTRCRECWEAGEKAQHIDGTHHVKVCWYWCPACNLVYSGSQDEYEAERSRREAHPRVAGADPVAPPIEGTPVERARTLRSVISEGSPQ